MRKGTIILAIVAIMLMVATLATPALSRSNFSGNQQYGYCSNCHSAASAMGATMESSPKTTVAIAPGSTVSVWINVTGTVSGATQVGALVAATTGSSGSLPSENGWTITSYPPGTSPTYNYYKNSAYTDSTSFKWVLTAPATAGAHPLYGRVLHSGSQEYTKSVGPLSFNVQAPTPGNPTVVINSPSNGATVSGTITVSATVTPGSGATITQVALSVDGAQRSVDTAAPYSFTLDTTTLSNAQHSLAVTATDNGARTGSQTITITVSNVLTQPPVVVISQPANGAQITGTITVIATVTPGQGAIIASVVLSVDGGAPVTMTGTPYSAPLDTNPMAAGQHTLTVTATDNEARTGSQSITVFKGSPTAPVVGIASPSNGATVYGTINVHATVTPSAGRTITSMDLRVDGVSQGAKTSAPYTWSLNTLLLSNGQHVVNVTATDNLASTGFMEIAITVGNLPPAVGIITPTPGAVLSGTQQVVANLTSVPPISYVELRLDGGLVFNSTSAPYQWNLDTTAHSEGQHVLNVTAVSSIGLRGYAQVTVTFVNKPVITITSPTQGAEYYGTFMVSVEVAGDAPVAYVLVKVNGNQTANLTTAPFSYDLDSSKFPDGNAVINITAVDTSGKTDSKQVTVVIDNAGQDEPLLEMGWTIAAGSLAIIAVLMASTTAVMFFRQRKGGES